MNEEQTTMLPEAEEPAAAAADEPMTDIPSGNEQPAPEAGAEEEKRELSAKLEALEAELLRERIKVLLLLSGILPEKLDDGTAMAYGLCIAGKAPETAASEIMSAYPHLKTVRRELPQFSADSRGSGDGFSAIRRIFSMK